MNSNFESIKQGLEEAIEFSNGRLPNAKVFKPTTVNVKSLRNDISMSQAEFAAAFGISLGTLRHWERGDRTPRGPALVLLNLLKKDPRTILRVLNQ